MNSTYFYHLRLSRCSTPFWKGQRLSHLGNSCIKIFYERPSGKYHMRGCSCAFGISHNYHSTWTHHYYEHWSDCTFKETRYQFMMITDWHIWVNGTWAVKAHYNLIPHRVSRHWVFNCHRVLLTFSCLLCGLWGRIHKRSGLTARREEPQEENRIA